MKAASGLYGLMLIFAAAPAVPTIPIADLPLFLQVAVPPNIVLTLDDSGSMRRAFVPENCEADTSDCALLDHRWEKSSTRNLIYYNPNIRYPAPRTGVGSNVLSTSFTAAYTDGFDTSAGTVNLSNNYRPTAALDKSPTSGLSQDYMGHHGSDVTRCKPSGTPKVCQYTTNTVAPFTWTDTGLACLTDDICRGTTNATNTQPNPVGVPAYYYVYNAMAVNCGASLKDDDCYSIRFVNSTSGPGTFDLNGDTFVTAADRDERQNFANWYSFARTRSLATQTAAAISFADLDPTIRVAWQGLHTCRGSETSLVDADCDGYKNNFSSISNAIRPFSIAAHKTNFYSWLFQQPTNSNTPLPEAMKRVGDYYKVGGTNSPYDDNLASSVVNTETSCRRNYHILMTDGIWTDTVSVGTSGDGTAGSLPDAQAPSYTVPTPPFSDSTNNTLADVAFKYWREDLRGTLTNNLTPSIDDFSDPNDTARYWNPKNNPATWQHMVNFTIGLGLTGYLSQTTPALTWSNNMYSGSYTSLKSGGTAWPAASSAVNNPANVADLWHAAINSRGKFFSADDPASLSDAFTQALENIAASSGSSAALSANSTSITPNNTFVYQAKFNSDWSGTLVAVKVENNGDVGAIQWDAAELTPAWASRKIFTHNGTSGLVFGDNACTAGQLSATQRTALNHTLAGVVDTNCQARVNWLRGDDSKETRKPAGIFRSRPVDGPKTIVMGDVINSDPAYVHALDFRYSALPASTPGQSSYAAFLTANAMRPAMLYVGSNDGKLYGIDATTGVEQFAYIPGNIYGHLGDLTDPAYTHQYYVDGSITVGDAFLGTSWSTILTAGLNSGGRAIYALDVTSPATFDASKVKWEFTEADLGLTYSQPQIGILESGQWVAVFGNGYNSTNGGAYLYVVDLANGMALNKIQLRDVAGDESNGVSTPLLVDSDANGMIDTAYAGDLLGNLWKVNLSGASGSWGAAYSGSPLFTATYPLPMGTQVQPITAQPKIGAHNDGGFVVYFGTGRYVASADVSDTGVQSFYAVYDNGAAVASRSQLQAQSFVSEAEIAERHVRETSNNAVNWSTQKGWYIDLKLGAAAAGERVVSTPLLKHNRAIFITVAPSGDACKPGGTSWLMELDMFTGSSQGCVLDLDGDGVFNEADDKFASGACPTGLELTVGISKTPVWLDPTPPDPNVPVDPNAPVPAQGFKFMTGTSGGIQSEAQGCTGNCGPPPPPPPPPGGPVKRRSWIQIR